MRSLQPQYVEHYIDYRAGTHNRQVPRSSRGGPTIFPLFSSSYSPSSTFYQIDPPRPVPIRSDLMGFSLLLPFRFFVFAC
jgi:hypothetical protein